MKIHALYTLITAVLVSAMPTRAPQPGYLSPDSSSPAAEQEADRPFDGFEGEAIELAWESPATEPLGRSLGDDTEAPKATADESSVITLADDGPAPAADGAGGFAAFGQMSEPEKPAEEADAATPSEWGTLGTATEQSAAVGNKLEELTSVRGILAEAASRFNLGEDGGEEGAEGAATGEAAASSSEPSIVSSSDLDIQIVPSGNVEMSQGPATQPGGVAPATGQPAEGGPAAQQIVSDEEGMWIRGARLNDVFQYLARLGNLQYFHNSDLDAPNFVVTGHLRDGDPVLQMEELGLMYGITIYQKGSTVYAMTSAQLSQLPTKPFQYNLRYLRPTDIDQIKAILQTMLTPGSGIIEYEPKTNTLIIIDNEQKVDTVREILAEIDKPKLQIAIETRILRINTDSSNKIGVDWESVLGDGLTIDAESSLNALFGLPDSDMVSEVISLTETALTGSSSEFIGESVFSATDGGSLLNGELDGDTSGSFTNSTMETTNTGNSSSNNSENVFNRSQNVAITGSNLVLTPLQLSATLRALNAGGLAQQESSPTLITEDNEQGIITVIDRIPIIVSTLSETDAGQNISEEVRYRIDPDDPTISEDPAMTREIGVSISVTPTILPDNTIRMALRPRSAQITDYVVGRSGNVFPRVNESSVETIARIPNGSSLLIGGFYEEIEGTKENKVPVLGDIPVLKFFFSSSEKTKNHTSLIFVVTPKLYEPASTTDTLSTSRDLQQRHVVPGDHPWPNRHQPGNGYEDNLGWTVGNMVDAYEPIPPSNPLNPEHPVNRPPEEGYVGEQRPHAPELDPAPQPRRRGLLHRLFNRQPGQ